jgi:hypothetical protein
MPFGKRTLHIRGKGGRIEVAPVLPGYEQIRERVFALSPVSE